ncbi:MAG: hypothetical protein ACOCQD_02060 [archaeon]
MKLFLSEYNQKAKKYLEDKQFKVCYCRVQNTDTLKEENILLQEEYPDFVPEKEEYVVLNNEEYIVYHRVYVLEKNKLFVFLMGKKEYKNLYLKERKRHV